MPNTSIHPAPIDQPDMDGGIHTYGVDVPVWKDGRFVENIFQWSEDFTLALWELWNGTKKIGVAVGVGPNGEAAMEIEFGSSPIADIRQVPPTTFDGDAQLSFMVRTVSGASSITVGLGPNDTNDIPISSSWTRVYTSAAITTGNRTMMLRNNTSGNTSNIYLLFGQLENATARADKITPSEYVKTGAAIASKMFGTANGNTAQGNGIVIESAGGELDPPAKLYAAVGEVENVFDAANMSNDGRQEWSLELDWEGDATDILRMGLTGVVSATATDLVLSDGANQTSVPITTDAEKVTIVTDVSDQELVNINEGTYNGKRSSDQRPTGLYDGVVEIYTYLGQASERGQADFIVNLKAGHEYSIEIDNEQNQDSWHVHAASSTSIDDIGQTIKDWNVYSPTYTRTFTAIEDAKYLGIITSLGQDTQIYLTHISLKEVNGEVMTLTVDGVESDTVPYGGFGDGTIVGVDSMSNLVRQGS